MVKIFDFEGGDRRPALKCGGAGYRSAFFRSRRLIGRLGVKFVVVHLWIDIELSREGPQVSPGVPTIVADLRHGRTPDTTAFLLPTHAKSSCKGGGRARIL
ncbi:MAG: hypothetical protein AB7J46_02220 [Candidatus Altimarinota bacterium]